MEPREYPQGSVEARVVEVLRTCYDPEIPVDVYELGLIYDVCVTFSGDIEITMTLTSPMCPVAESLPPEIRRRVAEKITDAAGVKVEVVWDPPWSTDRMSDSAKLELGML